MYEMVNLKTKLFTKLSNKMFHGQANDVSAVIDLKAWDPFGRHLSYAQLS